MTLTRETIATLLADSLDWQEHDESASWVAEVDSADAVKVAESIRSTGFEVTLTVERIVGEDGAIPLPRERYRLYVSEKE